MFSYFMYKIKHFYCQEKDPEILILMIFCRDFSLFSVPAFGGEKKLTPYWMGCIILL